MKILFPISLVADLAANVLAGPIVPSTNELKRQVISYRCTYPNSVPAATFRVAYVNSQIAVATIGGFDAGASGYPHLFNNNEELQWGVQNCDSGKYSLLEYPIYSDNKTSWAKGKKKSGQQPTPYRVVFANVGGTAIRCGVMAHESKTDDGGGSGPFNVCPSM